MYNLHHASLIYFCFLRLNFPACYIDVEDDQDEEEESGAGPTNGNTKLYRFEGGNDDELANAQSPWCDLPDHIMERIFAHLSIRQRYYASLVSFQERDEQICRNCLALVGAGVHQLDLFRPTDEMIFLFYFISVFHLNRPASAGTKLSTCPTCGPIF